MHNSFRLAHYIVEYVFVSRRSYHPHVGDYLHKSVRAEIGNAIMRARCFIFE